MWKGPAPKAVIVYQVLNPDSTDHWTPRTDCLTVADRLSDQARSYLLLGLARKGSSFRTARALRAGQPVFSSRYVARSVAAAGRSDCEPTVAAERNVTSPTASALLGLTAKPPKLRGMLPLAASSSAALSRCRAHTGIGLSVFRFGSIQLTRRLTPIECDEPSR